MRQRTPLTLLIQALSVVAVVASLSACRDPAREKLPVCPGDPRCESVRL